MDDKPLAHMADQRNPLQPAQTLTLYADRLESWTEDRLVRRIALSDVTQVRLAVEMAGSQSQVVCRVTGPAGDIVFGSRRAQKGGFDDNVVAFQTLMVALHEALRPRFDQLSFVEGQSMGFKLIMAGLGVTMAAIALAFMGWFALVEESALLTVAGFPFLVIGGYLAWMFRPTAPLHYDPEKLIERFSGGVGT